jgi:hypothetical protein
MFYPEVWDRRCCRTRGGERTGEATATKLNLQPPPSQHGQSTSSAALQPKAKTSKASKAGGVGVMQDVRRARRTWSRVGGSRCQSSHRHVPDPRTCAVHPLHPNRPPFPAPAQTNITPPRLIHVRLFIYTHLQPQTLPPPLLFTPSRTPNLGNGSVRAPVTSSKCCEEGTRTRSGSVGRQQ